MTNPKIVILNASGDHGQEMALYADGKLMGTAIIDGGEEFPCDLAAFLCEFGVSASSCGITDVTQLVGDADVMCESRPGIDEDDYTEEELGELLEKLDAAGALDERDCVLFAENLDDIAMLIPELQE